MGDYIHAVAGHDDLIVLSQTSQIFFATGRYLILIGLVMFLITLMIMFNIKNYLKKPWCYFFIFITFVVLIFGTLLQVVVSPHYYDTKSFYYHNIYVKEQRNWNPMAAKRIQYKTMWFSPKSNDLDKFNNRSFYSIYSKKPLKVTGDTKVLYKHHWYKLKDMK